VFFFSCSFSCLHMILKHGLRLVVLIAFLGNFLKEKSGRLMMFFTALKNDFLLPLHFLLYEHLVTSYPLLSTGILRKPGFVGTICKNMCRCRQLYCCVALKKGGKLQKATSQASSSCMPTE